MIVELVVLSGLAVANDKYPEATQRAIRGVLVATGWSLKTSATLIKRGLDTLSRLGESQPS
jgi:hypothetical protein